MVFNFPTIYYKYDTTETKKLTLVKLICHCQNETKFKIRMYTWSSGMNQSITNMTDTTNQSSARKVNHVSYSSDTSKMTSYSSIFDGLVNGRWLLSNRSFSCGFCSRDYTCTSRRWIYIPYIHTCKDRDISIEKIVIYVP